MIYRKFIEYCKKQDDKPENTTNFIKTYQQQNSGKGTCLHNAILAGKMIYKREGEPNQRWHLITSWYPDREDEIAEKEVDKWCGLRCPELLLWIAEVSGQKDNVETVVKDILKDDDKYGANDGKARNEMVKYIKEKIQWQDIINYIEDKMQS